MARAPSPAKSARIRARFADEQLLLRDFFDNNGRRPVRNTILDMKFAIIGAFCLLTVTGGARGQTAGSHEDCLKRVPGDWGPNFGNVWHRNEALYWGCRLGVPPETVEEWQRAANEMGAAEQISQSKVEGRDLVLIEEMGGSAHCFDVTVLAKPDGNWRPVWRLPVPRNSMNYCTGACPAVRARIDGTVLTVETPLSRDPKEDTTFSCKHVKWRKETFRWTGKTFAP